MRLVVLTVLAALAACGSFDPRPVDEVPFRERLQTESDDVLTVSVTVLDDAEANQVFGRNLAKKGMQPVWIEITNHSDVAWLLLPIGVDPNYFAPYEAAYRNRITWGGSTNRKIADHFLELDFEVRVAPGETNRGFVLTNLDRGVKAVTLDLVSREGVRQYEFLVPVANLRTDYEQVDFDELYTDEAVVDYRELEGFRAAVEGLPRCSADKAGTGEGDPLNFVVIGPRREVLTALVRAGWHATETIYGGSAWRTGVSFVFGTQYRYSPVSALYVFGRPQDAAFQKARDNIHVRNHLRLWKAPMTWKGTAVFAGQISRDIGVGWSKRTIVTHKIDPWVDEARWQLTQELVRNEALAMLGYTDGVGVSLPSEPRHNLGNDPYFTDGLRAVFFLAEDPVPVGKIRILPWRLPGEENRSLPRPASKPKAR